MGNDKALERMIVRTGQEIYALMGEEVPSFFHSKRWKGRLTEWAMKDEAFKVQLFRFVDVLPSLKSDSLVVSILKEYFGDLESAPMIIRQAAGRLSKSGVLPHLAARAIRSAVESLAGQFIAGRSPEDAYPALERLNKDGLAFSVDLLGEEVLSHSEARQYAERYRALLEFLSPKVYERPEVPLLDTDERGPISRLDVSLKVSSFYSQLDPVDWEGSISHTKESLKHVLEPAAKHRASVTFDMEQYYLKDLTIAIFQRVLDEETDLPSLGIALQAYLKDAKEDLLKIISQAKKTGQRLTVRLVKGAYWDYEMIVNRQKGWPVPVFLNKDRTDFSYEMLTTTILENTEYLRPAIATHNVRSISHAISLAQSLRLPKDAFEFQMIYGMAEPVRRAVQRLGYRVRVYTPVGELIPGMAYLIRRLLENTMNESFLRKSFVDRTPFSELIKPPQPVEKTGVQENFAEGFRNEPSVDFSRAENREKMKQALSSVRERFKTRYPLFIGGEELWAQNEIRSVNPARPSELVGVVSAGSAEHAERAVLEAQNAWKTWGKTSWEERAHFLLRAAEEMKKRRHELMALEVYEVGKTWTDADGDFAEAIDYLRYYGQQAIRLGRRKAVPDYPGEENQYLYEPRGVGLVISPWNFPLAIPTGMVSAGIVSGNCVIFKPSGLSTLTAWKLVEIFRLVDLPPGVLQFVPGPGAEVGEFLVAHPLVDFVAFTGSKDVGLRIVRLAAETLPNQKNVKRVIAEMGGKNAIIVDETADLDEAVKGVLESALGFQGQKCSACSRVIVVGELFGEFCRRLRDAMESVNIGPPEDPGNRMGPVIDEAALAKITRYREMGAKTGKVLLAREAHGEGFFIGPVMITDVEPDSPIAQEEIFGPVITMMKARDIDHAFDIANTTPYALTGGIFSRSPRNIRKAREEFRVGNLYVNRKITGALVGRQPFGGFGMSGVGFKAGGPDYLLQFTNTRSVSENTMRRGFAPIETDH